MYREKVGLIGGFGAYAALDFYKRILEAFASESERNYPHIIMDNDFTMPSRTRALLYDEAYGEVVEKISESMHLMLQNNVSRIILVCGTAHFFLEDVYHCVPEARGRVLDMIEVMGEEIQKHYMCGEMAGQVLVIAAEGALLKELYPKRLEKYGIKCENPGTSYFMEIRYFIECVKRDAINEQTRKRFIDFLEAFGISNVILGCTEFPVLINDILETNNENYNDILEKYCFFDPLEMVIERLKTVLQ